MFLSVLEQSLTDSLEDQMATPRTPQNTLTAPATVIVLLCIQAAVGWVVPQPTENVWVTLAKSLKQDNFCMAMGGAEDPLSTCLVGIPLSPNEYPYAGKKPTLVDTWDAWMKILPHAPQELQERDLPGSSMRLIV